MKGLSRASDDAVPVAVLGAGLTGLSSSFFLRRAGVPHRVYEKAAHPGGHAVTLEEAGYRFDRTGHLLHLRDPEIRELVLSWLEPHSYVEIARKSAVYSHGVYTRYPFQSNTFGLPPEVIAECLLGVVEASKSSQESAPADFEAFCLAHFGEGISRHFMIPYNQKLWGVHPREITASWCSRFVPIPRLEDVIRGAVGVVTPEIGYNTTFLYPRLGAGQLVDALAERAGPVETSRAPRSIDLSRRVLVFEDGEQPFRELLSTIPLPRLVELLSDAPHEVRDAQKRLRATELYYLDVALNTPCEKPYHWVYVPEERFPFYRVGCYSHFSAAMAPSGKASLYVELASREIPDLGALLPRVAADLTEMGLIRAPEAIRFARVRHVDPAYVVFDRDHAGAVEIIERFLHDEGIVSTGRYGAWNYSSMEDALRFGRDAARSAMERLGPTPGGT